MARHGHCSNRATFASGTADLTLAKVSYHFNANAPGATARIPIALAPGAFVFLGAKQKGVPPMNATAQAPVTEQEDRRHRLQFDFSPEAYDRLKRLRNKAEARTFAEMVRNALRLYEWFLDQKDRDLRIALIDHDEKVVREIELIL